MKLGRVSCDEIQTLWRLYWAIDLLQQGVQIPENIEEEADFDKRFDINDFEHCQNALNFFLYQIKPNDVSQCAMNLDCLLSAENQLIDLNENCLEMHPRLIQALKDSERLTWLIGNGDQEKERAALDEAMGKSKE